MNSSFFWYTYIIIAIIMTGVATMHAVQGSAGRAAFAGIVAGYFMLRLWMMSRSEEPTQAKEG